MSAEKGFAPFYEGQRVLAVDALPGSSIKNGQQYIVSDCHYSPSNNPIANGKWFWYVGIIGFHRWLRPGIFAPIEENFQSISLSEILKEETKLIGTN